MARGPFATSGSSALQEIMKPRQAMLKAEARSSRSSSSEILLERLSPDSFGEFSKSINKKLHATFKAVSSKTPTSVGMSYDLGGGGPSMRP